MTKKIKFNFKKYSVHLFAYIVIVPMYLIIHSLAILLLNIEDWLKYLDDNYLSKYKD